MVKVKIYKDLDIISKFSISGHAKYNEDGDDIVCAAASVLGYTALNSLIDVCGIDEKEIQYTIDEEGYLEVILPQILDKSLLERTQIVLQTFLVGIKSMVESYPKYITLEYRGGVIDD